MGKWAVDYLLVSNYVEKFVCGQKSDFQRSVGISPWAKVHEQKSVSKDPSAKIRG